MHLLFLFLPSGNCLSPSQADLFDSTPVVIILIMVCPALAFFNTSSVLFSFEGKKFFNNWKLTVVEKQFTVAIFLRWHKYSFKKKG